MQKQTDFSKFTRDQLLAHLNNAEVSVSLDSARGKWSYTAVQTKTNRSKTLNATDELSAFREACELIGDTGEIPAEAPAVAEAAAPAAPAGSAPAPTGAETGSGTGTGTGGEQAPT